MRDKGAEQERAREMWAISQLAVTGVDEPQVVQLGASSSPESVSNRDGPASSPGGNHSLPYANDSHLISSLPMVQFKMSLPPEVSEDESHRCFW